MNNNEAKLSLVDIQRLELEIAKEIKRICEENDIQYFLIGGSLLGAVRHHGFIPWDDDMDIGMTLDNYEKFLTVAQTQLDSSYKLQHWDDGTAYAYPFAKVKMLGTHVTEKVNRNLNIDKGVWVDVFPYYPAKMKYAKSHFFMLFLQTFSKMCLLKNGYDLNGLTNNTKSKITNTILRYAPVSASKARDFFIRQLKKKGEDENDYYIECDGMFKGNFVFPKKYFSALVALEFNNESFMAPAKYHEYLSDAYGDYMKLPSVEEQQRGHSLLDAVIENKGELP